MKKIAPVLLCLILLMAMVIPVSAEGTVKLTLKADKTTVYRGDTINLTITASGGGTCQSYGYKLKINTEVFELVSSSVTDSNDKSLSQFSADKGLVVGYSSPAVPSGTVCKFSLKVRSDAPLNTSYKLSGDVSAKLDGVSVSASGSGVTIKVSCNHSYGGWQKADDTNHQRTCSACSNVDTEKHSWNDGTVVKEPNCKETGKKEFSCTKCGAKKSTELETTDDHQFDSLNYVNETKHQSVCKVCSKTVASDHVWETVQVLKKATCKETGEATYRCSGCKKEKTEVVPKSTKHTYDHDCDPDCNICGLTRETSHSYKKTWSKNALNHYHSCKACGDKIDIEKHIPGPEATEQKPQTCKTCGYVIKPALSHEHDFSSQWTMDDTGHWHICESCEEKQSFAAHGFDNGCDPTCDVCGYTRETEHETAEDWKITETEHISYCVSCGLEEEHLAHEPGETATELTPQLCKVCGYELAPALGHAFGKEFIAEEESHYRICQCGEKTDEEPHGWDVVKQGTETEYTCGVCGYSYTVEEDITWMWFVLGGLGVALVAIILVLILRKRKD